MELYQSSVTTRYCYFHFRVQVGGLDAGAAGKQELSAFEQIAEQRIREAAAQGELRGLKGEGKPQRLDGPALETAEDIGAKLLKDANLVPDWVAEQRRLADSTASHRNPRRLDGMEGRSNSA